MADDDQLSQDDVNRALKGSRGDTFADRFPQVAQADSSGTPVYAMEGGVPANLPQNVQMQPAPAAPQAQAAPSPYDVYQQNVGRINKFEQNVVNPTIAAEKQVYGEMANMPHRALPQLIPPPAYPDFKPSTLQQIAPAVMTVMALGGGIVKNFNVARAKSMTGLINGWNKASAEQRQNMIEDYKYTSERANQINQDMVDHYNRVLADDKLTWVQKQAQLTGIASEFDHKLGIEKLQQGAIKEFVDMTNALTRSQGRLSGSLAQMSLPPGRTQAALDNAIEQTFLTGKYPPGVSNRIADSSYRAAIDNGVAQRVEQAFGQGPQATDRWKNQTRLYNSQQAAINKFTSGPQGDRIQFAGVALDHMNTMDELIDALHQPNGLGLFRDIAQRWATQTGNPAPTNLQAAAGIVGAEIVKSVVNAGGIGKEREAAGIKSYQLSRHADQLHGLNQTYRSLLLSQIKGVRDRFVSSTGLSEEDFNQ